MGYELEVQRLRDQIAELEGTLPGRIKSAQALADEKCRCVLMRAEAAEARLAVYSSGGFADADALAAAYLDISAERDALRDQIRVLREALNAFLDRHISLVNSGDCGCWNPEDDSEVKQARAALAATEPSK